MRLPTTNPVTNRSAIVVIALLVFLAAAFVALTVDTGPAFAAPGDPNATITTPGSGQALLGTPSLVLRGEANDDSGVVRTAVAIRNPAANAWLQPNGTWASGFSWVDATTNDAGAASVEWSFEWTPPAPGTYGMTAQAYDAAGNIDRARQWVRFSVSDTTTTTTTTMPPTTTTTTTTTTTMPPTTTTTTTTTTTMSPTTTTTTTQPPVDDLTPPNSNVVVPGSNQTFGEGAVGFAGTAQDNVAVAAVDIAVRRNDSQQWLHADGTWGGFAWINGSLNDPGSPTTDWSLTFTPPTAGTYGMMARSVDAAGNTGAMSWRSFTSAGPGSGGGGGGGGGGGDCTPDSPPYGIGEMTVNLTDSSRGRSLQTTIFYPATSSGVNAPAACGPFPMVMTGHGGSGTGRSGANLFRFLVNDGYFIVGPTFPAGFQWDLLAGDVSYVIDEMIAMRSDDGPIAQFDGESIGFIGTSKGGAIGYATFLECCGDARIDAVIPRAGVPIQGAIDYVNGPAVLILNGDADEFAPWDWAQSFYDSARTPKGIIRFAGVGHDLNIGSHGILQDAPRGFFDFVLKGDPSGKDVIIQSVNTLGLATIQYDW